MRNMGSSYYWVGFLRIEFIGAILLIIFLFLPWVEISYSFVSFSVQGYALPDISKDMNQFYDNIYDLIGLKPEGSEKSYALYLVYLIPVLSAIIIVLQIFQKPIIIPTILLTLLPIGGFIFLLFEYGNKTFELLATGAYLSLITAIIMLLAISRVFNNLMIKILIRKG